VSKAPRRSPEEERVHRKQRLAAAFRMLARAGHDEGAGGHVTARDPIEPDRFWVNPFGRYFGHLRVSDLLLVDPQGRVVQGEGRVNPAAYAIHSEVHAARPDVVAAAHAHSVHGRALAALHRRLAPITQDACAFYETHDVYDDYSGVVLERDEGKRIARALGEHKALILANHGLLTVGGSVEEATWWFLSLDRCCQVQLLAQAAGEPREIDPAGARQAREEIGSAAVARLNFRPLYEAVTRAEPDLFE
jgi:ribulose-5-phosphate 4-epimerase/fuculose-1-phosphate aldolase